MRARTALTGGLIVVAAGTTLALRQNDVEATAKTPPLAQVAARVETIRGLQFKQLPAVRWVSKAQLQRETDEQLAQMSGSERARIAAEQEVLKLLGFLDPRARPQDAGNTDGIFGLYDFDTKKLTLVKDAGGDRFQAELTYAHELAHALEDQHLRVGAPARRGGDDAQAAYRAVAEGSATVVEAAYGRRHLGGTVTTKRLARSDQASTKKGKLDFFENENRFLYMDGGRFVAQVQRRGGWRLVNQALRARPPRSTESILHPEVYLDGEEAEAVRMDVGAVAGPRFHRLAAGGLGEFDTSQMLLFGAGVGDEITRREAAAGAAGWAGGRFELWRAGRGDEGCSKPCVERDLLVLGWRWDAPKQAAEFVRLLRPYLESYQELSPAGRGVWRGDVAAAAVHVDGRDVTLALAPAAPLARLVAKRARAGA